MKRLNYYQAHKNKKPSKLKFYIIRKEKFSLTIKIDTRIIEKALAKASKQVLHLGNSLSELKIHNFK
jgi:uncharacterized membrane protein YcaP (DUF421 family)